MNINKFSLYITPEDIYNRILPEQREQLDKVIITSADLLGDGYVHIECMALEKGTTVRELSCRQSLCDCSDEYKRYITTLDI